jgi:hypothetical protein
MIVLLVLLVNNLVRPRGRRAKEKQHATSQQINGLSYTFLPSSLSLLAHTLRSSGKDCFTYRKVSGQTKKKRRGTSSIGGHTNLRTFRGISTSSERKNEARTSRVVFLFSLLYLASKGHSLPIAVISERSGLDPDIRCSSWIVIEEEHTLARWDLHQEVARGRPTIPSRSTATTTITRI